MQAIIFCGIQATGKSSFYKQNFFNSHVRISLDLLKTRNREKQFMETCFKTSQKFVIDNTNLTKKDRKKYIEIAKDEGYEVIGYYFQSKIKEALERNNKRTGIEKIPEIGIKGSYNNLEIPSKEEGFDTLYFVRISENNQFIIENWQDEIG